MTDITTRGTGRRTFLKGTAMLAGASPLTSGAIALREPPVARHHLATTGPWRRGPL